MTKRHFDLVHRFRSFFSSFRIIITTREMTTGRSTFLNGGDEWKKRRFRLRVRGLHSSVVFISLRCTYVHRLVIIVRPLHIARYHRFGWEIFWQCTHNIYSVIHLSEYLYTHIISKSIYSSFETHFSNTNIK